MVQTPQIPNISGNLSSFIEIARTNPAQTGLALGDLLTVDVIETLAENKFILSLNGTKVQAQSEVPLSAGTTLQVKVFSLQPKLQLQIHENPSRTTELPSHQFAGYKADSPTSLIEVLGRAPANDDVQKAKGKWPIELVSGQNVTITVLEKGPGNQHQFAIRDFMFAATSDIPLQVGQKLQVKVQSLEPQVILTVTDPQRQAAHAKVNERLVQWRIYPDAMAQMIAKSAEFTENIKSLEFPLGVSQQDIDHLKGLLNKIVYSSNTLKNQMFIRDFVAQTGMMLERGLALQAGLETTDPMIAPSDHVRQSLSKILETVYSTLRSSTKLDIETTAKFKEFAIYAENVLRDLPLAITKKDTETLIQYLGHLASFAKAKNIPPSLRNMVMQARMDIEKNWIHFEGKKNALGVFDVTNNVKASLLKLSEALQQSLQIPEKQSAWDSLKLQNLSLFVTDALRTIESSQAVNVVYQQNENGLCLQIPIVLGNAYRQADIFIAPGAENAKTQTGYSSCSVKIFLNLDYLGEMYIDVGIHQGNIRCIIKCESLKTKEILEKSSQELEAALIAVGYGVRRIECVEAKNLADEKAEFIASHILGDADLVNSYA